MAEWRKDGMHPDLQRFMSDVFIETGTYQGLGVIAATEAGFPRVETVEFIPKILNAVLGTLEEALTPEEFGRVRFRAGSSVNVLPAIISELNASNRRATFWLDAHVQGQPQKKHRYPLLQELDLMRHLGRIDHIIMMDDCRLWKGWRIPMHKVRNRLRIINPDYAIFHVDGFVKDDVLIACPKEI